MLTGEKILLGATSPTRDFTYIKDTIRGFIRAAESETSVGEVVNLGTGKEISIGDLAMKIASLIGKEIEIQSDEQRFRPGSSEVMRLCGDIEKAKSLIGWEPQFTLEEGLRQTIEWLRKSGDMENSGRYHI